MAVQFTLEGRNYTFPAADTLTLEDAILIKNTFGTNAPSITQMISDLQDGTADEFTLFSLFVIAKARADGGVDPQAIRKLPIASLEITEIPDPEDAKSEEKTPLAPSSGAGKKKSAKSDENEN